MEIYQIQNELTSIFDKEALRIIKILLDMHNKKTKVNKSFDLLVKELIKKELQPYESLILLKTTSLIPDNLIICPNNEWVFIDIDEFNNSIKQKQTDNIINKLNENRETINELSKKIITNYTKDRLEEKNILEIIFNYVPENKIKKFDSDVISYIIQNLVFKISEEYDVISINPLIIKEL